MPDKNKLEMEIAVLKNEILNVKEVAEESKKQNTAEHLEIRTNLTAINLKLDKAIECKAEVTDLRTLDNRIWALIIGFLMLLAGVIAAYFKG